MASQILAAPSVLKDDTFHRLSAIVANESIVEVYSKPRLGQFATVVARFTKLATKRLHLGELGLQVLFVRLGQFVRVG